MNIYLTFYSIMVMTFRILLNFRPVLSQQTLLEIISYE